MIEYTDQFLKLPKCLWKWFPAYLRTIEKKTPERNPQETCEIKCGWNQEGILGGSPKGPIGGALERIPGKVLLRNFQENSGATSEVFHDRQLWGSLKRILKKSTSGNCRRNFQRIHKRIVESILKGIAEEIAGLGNERSNFHWWMNFERSFQMNGW